LVKRKIATKAPGHEEKRTRRICMNGFKKQNDFAFLGALAATQSQHKEKETK
jgi:hypothetical protein